MADSLRLVDSHAHLDMPEFDADRPDVVRRAFAACVAAILCPADLTRPASLPAIAALEAEFPTVLAAAGVHAHQAKDLTPDHLSELERLAAAGAIRAVGERGLDYHYDFSPPAAQRETLRRQLAVAARAGLPVILHSRLAGADIVAAIDGERFGGGGVLHCFTEDWPVARALLDRGLLRAPVHCQFVLGLRNALPPRRRVLEFLVSELGDVLPGTTWTAAGIGQYASFACAR